MEEAKEVVAYYKAQGSFPKHLKFLRNAGPRDLWVCIDTQLEYEQRGAFSRVLPDLEFSKYVLPNRNLLVNEWLQYGVTLADLSLSSIPSHGIQPEESNMGRDMEPDQIGGMSHDVSACQSPKGSDNEE
jgi:hypothetical protein